MKLTVPFYPFTVWLILMQLNCGFYFGPAISTALQKFPEIPAQATAFQGFQKFISTFIIASILLIFFKHSIIGLSIMMLITTSLSACITLSIKHKYEF